MSVSNIAPARRSVLSLLLAIALPTSVVLGSPVGLATDQSIKDVLDSPAVLASHPEQSVFMDLARAGSRLVAVGERGLILLSDDNGQRWRQVQVPVSVGLTAVQFVDADHGWAVGHAGVILTSRDGGETWVRQLDGHQAARLELEAAQRERAGAIDDEAAQVRVQTAERMVQEGADKPFLALAFTDANHGLVVGAYGLALRTEDGGVTWSSVQGTIDNPTGLHLYAAVHQGGNWFLAGEQGYLARSDDGRHFRQLQSPYNGTFFTLIGRDDHTLLIAGLKGHAFTLDENTDSISPLPMLMPVSFSDAVGLADGRTLLANQAGGIFVSGPQAPGRLLPALPPTGKPLSGLIQAADGSLVVAGFTGLSRLSLPAVSASE